MEATQVLERELGVANDTCIEQGRLLAARNMEIDELHMQIGRLQEEISDRKLEVEELSNQLIASTSQSESYWRAAEGFRIQLLGTIEHRDEGNVQSVGMCARIAELEQHMQSLRSLREQAERVAVAEVKCQREVECETNVLKEKVASQAQIITELSEQLSANQRSSEARDGSVKAPIHAPLVSAEDDASVLHVVSNLKTQVATLEARLQVAGKAHAEMFSAERSRRAASEAALRECHITDLKAAALRQRLQQDEKHELSVKMSEMMKMAADRNEETDELKARIATLEEELESCKSQLGERHHAIDALIEEFDFFRSSTLAEAQDQLDEMSAVVELQQNQLGASELAPTSVSPQTLQTIAKRLRAIINQVPHGAKVEPDEQPPNEAFSGVAQEIMALVSQVHELVGRQPQESRNFIPDRDQETEWRERQCRASECSSEARWRHEILESENRALAQRVARQRETCERLLHLNEELTSLNKHRAECTSAQAAQKVSAATMVSPCMTASPIPALGLVHTSPWVS